MANKKYLNQYTLTTEHLTKNLNFFKSIQEKYNPYTEELLIYLSDNGFFICPASTALTMHNCFEGGLLDHLIRVGKYVTELNKLLPKSLKQEQDSIVKVVFNHSIGKVGLYEENDSKWHKENLSQYYVYKTDQDVAMRINEKSAYLAMKFGVKLELWEYQAIINQGKLDDDLQAKYFSDPLTVILKHGISLAMMEEQQTFKEFQEK